MSRPQIDGIINVNKPYGVTSMDVVRRAKRASGQKRVGHGGTLDPVATGVVPVCFGQATRMMEFLVDSSKEYRAIIKFGETTDSYDSFGEIVSEGDATALTMNGIECALEEFRGSIKQVPPMYSALKKDGKRLYELARAGIEVEREPRPVDVYDIKLVDWEYPLATIEIACGRGFYVRSFAHDLGNSLGCGGHMTGLIRTRSGRFAISDSYTLEEVEQYFDDSTWPEILHTPDFVLSSLTAIIVGTDIEEMIRNGRALPTSVFLPVSYRDGKCRAYSVDGRFLALLKFEADSGLWRPDKVFSLNYPEVVEAI